MIKKYLSLFLIISSLTIISASEKIIKPKEWINFNHISGVKIEKKCFEAKFAGIDPFLISKDFTPINSSNYKYVEFDLKVPKDCTSAAQIFWKTSENNKFSSARYLNIKLHNDGKWHTYKINMKLHKYWTGEITGIRFDPAVSPEKLETFQLRNFKLTTSDKSAASKGISVKINLKNINNKPLVAKYPKAMFSNSGALLIKGKPEFVLGTGDMPVVDSPFSKLAQAGFNLITFSGISQGIIDEIQKNNLNIMLSVRLNKNETFQSFGKKVSSMYKKYPQLKSIVAAYYTVDEPVWVGFPLKSLKEAYQYYKSLKPRRPVWMNHAPRNSIELLKKFNIAADITGCDIYPVPNGGHSNLSDKTISSIGAYTDKMYQTALAGQPVWMYLQAYARAKTIPTYHETRFMAYNAIMHGAMGIYYYGLRHMRWPNKMWPQLQKIGPEIRSLNDILVAPWNSKLIKKDGIEIRVKIINGKRYIFAANTVNSPRKLSFSINDELKKLFVLFEDRQINSTNSVFVDKFKPYSIHIYSENHIKKKQPPALKESNLTWISKNEGYWIWHSQMQKQKNAKVYFRRIIDINKIPAKAIITITADNNYQLFCNGKLVGADINSSKGGWQVAERYNLKSFLCPNSENIIAIEATNDTGMAGLWVEIQLGKEKVFTDERWRVSYKKDSNWKGSFSDENWDTAKTYGQPPCEPWNSFMVPQK